jgi:hypothetical protein
MAATCGGAISSFGQITVASSFGLINHYYSKLNGGGQTVHLHQKVMVNLVLTEAVGPPASVN